MSQRPLPPRPSFLPPPRPPTSLTPQPPKKDCGTEAESTQANPSPPESPKWINWVEDELKRKRERLQTSQEEEVKEEEGNLAEVEKAPHDPDQIKEEGAIEEGEDDEDWEYEDEDEDEDAASDADSSLDLSHDELGVDEDDEDEIEVHQITDKLEESSRTGNESPETKSAAAEALISSDSAVREDTIIRTSENKGDYPVATEDARLLLT